MIQMSEKVLGFKEKDGCYNLNAWICDNCGLLHEEAVNDCCCESKKIKLVSVRLASKSVDLERLRKYCKEEIRRCYGDSELDQVEIDTLTKIQEWAEKEAKKQAGEKK